MSLNNSNTALNKLGALTTSWSNVALIACLSFALLRKDVRTFAAVAALTTAASSSAAPLSNTLFAMHPPMLVIGTTGCVTAATRRSANCGYPLTGLFAAMVGGGFWSAQELNGGGWGNWDVLEMGSLTVGTLSMIFAHAGPSVLAARLAAVSVLSPALSFYALNKTGVGVSIHSFVTSEVLRTNYLCAIAFATATAAGCTAATTTAAIACVLIYSGATDLSALKMPLCVLSAGRPRARGGQSLTHKYARAVALCVAVVNYYNVLFAAAHTLARPAWLVSAGPRAAVGFHDHVLVHATGGRAKPRTVLSGSSNSCSLRSPSGRPRGSAYAK